MTAKVLFVCLGNICRSPAAEEILRHMAKAGSQEVEVSSCGLGDWHLGAYPDHRMLKAAQMRGFMLSSRAKMIEKENFAYYDLILAADHEVLHNLYKYAATAEEKAKLHLINDFSAVYKGQDVPDPYYQGEAGFELVLDMLEDACEGILSYLEKEKKI